MDSKLPTEIVKKVKKCVDKLMKDDKPLLERDAHEVSITHILGCYLQQKFNYDWNVDCEYNRYGNDGKKRNNGRPYRPDIIVHKRDEKKIEGNLLMIQVKKDNALSTKIKNAKNDLKDFTSKNNEPQYQWGLLLIVPVGASSNDKSPNYTWFTNGEEIIVE